MQPLYADGDYVVVSKIPLLWRSIEAGDVIVFRHSAYGTMIKMVENVEDQNSIRVAGTGVFSVDSRHFGALSSSNVLGKVIWRVRKVE